MTNFISCPIAIVSTLLLTIHVSHAEAPRQQPLKLGMVAPLTGDFSPFGAHIRHGIELAQSDLEKRGILTHLVAEDACLPTQVRTAFTKLTTSDRILALVGSYCVIGMAASQSILEGSRTIGFQTSGGTKEILGAGDYLFTTTAKTTDEASTLAEYAFNKLGLRKVAVLYLNTQWGEEFNEAFSKAFTGLGGVITGIASAPLGQNTFGPELTKLRHNEPDSLLIVHIASALGIAIKQAREVGHSEQLLATSDGEEESVIKEAGSRVSGLILFSPEPKVETDEMKRFRDAFLARFGQEPHPLARHSYDATILSAITLNKCKMDRECAKKLIYETQAYHGASGTFSVNSDGGTTRTFVKKMVRDGRFVRD